MSSQTQECEKTTTFTAFSDHIRKKRYYKLLFGIISSLSVFLSCFPVQMPKDASIGIYSPRYKMTTLVSDQNSIT